MVICMLAYLNLL